MSLFILETNGQENATENYHLKIKKIGQEFCSPNKKTEKYRASSYSLHFILFGSGTLVDGDKIYKLSAGNAFLLYEGKQYEYYPDVKNPWSYFWIDILGENLDILFERAGFSVDGPVIKIARMTELNSLLRNLHDSYSNQNHGEMAYYGYFMLILDRIFENSTISLADHGEILNYKRIRDILIYMNCNYRMDLTPRVIGEKFNISYGTLMVIFKSEIGMSPMEYLMNFRISHACEMLREDSRISIGEISSIVGYPDQRYFSRVFKKLKGVTPTEYSDAEHVEDPYEWLKLKNIDFR